MMFYKLNTAAAKVLLLSVLVLAGYSEAAAIRWTRTEHTAAIKDSLSNLSKRATFQVSTPRCTDPGDPENGVRIGNTFAIGSIIEFACNPGYLLRGTEVLVCGWSEQNEPEWDGDAPQCVAQVPILNDSPPDPCGRPPEPSTFAYRISYIIGERVEYRCINDYVISAGQEVLTCISGSAEWRGELLQCRRRGQCQDFGEIENGVRVLDGTREGDMVAFQCNEGFDLLGYRQLTCESDDNWSGIWPACTMAPAQCGDPGHLANGNRIVQGTTEGSQATFTCNRGYVLIGISMRVCGTNGQWSGSFPRCQRVVCRNPDVPSNGVVKFSSTEYGSVATFECDSGYLLSGARTSVCDAEGEWSMPPPTCSAVMCSALRSPAHGTVRARQRSYGSMANYSCSSGYGLVGEATRMCQASGLWTGTMPSCQPGTCGTLPDPQNGRVTINRLSTGGVAVYSCDVGYTLSGNFQRICSLFGIWSDEEPTCEPVRCPMLRPPYNGSLTLSDENKLNSVANYACNYGFQIIGNKLRVCQSSGIWTGRPPGCYEIDCGDIESPHHGDVMYTDTRFGSEAVYSCIPGYSLRFGDEIRTCVNGGRWSGNEPCCIRNEVLCPSLVAPANGFVMFERYIGAVATYTCDQGLVVVGDAMQMCQASGEWRGEMPFCSNTCSNLTFSDDNGTVNQTGNLPGDVATYSCASGFRIDGNDSRLCQTDGEWSGSEPSCYLIPSTSVTPADCGNLTDPDNGSVNTSIGTTVGSEAVYSCNEGYDLIGSKVRVCTSLGAWSDTEPVCVLRDCGSLMDPDNGAVDLSQGTTFGAVANYSCDLGYDIVGMDTTRACQSDGEWSSTAPTCMLVDCDVLKPPDNGMVDLSNGTTFGSRAVYGCNNRYELSDTSDRVCQENGLWSGNAPVCNRLQCEILIPPPNTTISLTNGNFIESVAFYECISDTFKFIGQRFRTCTISGWSDAPPSCELIDCGLLDSPSNGSVTLLSGTTLGSQATYSCNDNFRLIGNETRECLSSCQWSSDAPVCEPLQCPRLLPPVNGSVDVPSHTVGSIATYSCNKGLTLFGDEKRECLSDETWSGADQNTVCLLLTCPTLSDPVNGTVTVLDNIPEGMAIYSCNAGLTLIGGSTRTCQFNQQWSGDPPTCEEILCPVLASPENGRVIFNLRTPGSVATYICDETFSRVGLLSRTCQEDGQWGGNGDPICIMMECDPDDLGVVPNGEVNFNDVSVGSIATYTCDDDYKLVGGNETRTCVQEESTVRWNGDIPTCQEIICPALDPPLNGEVFVETPTFRGRAFYSCNEGFTIQGTPNRACGADCQWTGSAPTCEPTSTVACPILMNPANGEITISNTAVGSTVSYTCNPGYELDGPQQRTCMIDGNWSGTDPVCNAIDCGPLEVMNGSVNIPSGTTVLAGIAFYNCNPGFILRGSDNIRTCQDNGQWSGVAPTCELIDCGSLTDPVNGMVNTSAGTTFISLATYSCIEGYRLEGTPTRVCTADGLWSDEEPTCILRPGFSDCGDPGVPTDGTRTLTSTTTNSVVEYSCNSGFTLVGDDVRTCQESGEWNGTLPTCEPVRCPTLENPPNGIVDQTLGNMVNSQAFYICFVGFSLRPGDVFLRRCLPSGEWSETDSQCISDNSFSCPSLSDPVNGVVIVDSLSVGSIANYSCDNGYMLVGSSSLRCEPKGRWSDLEPVCERVRCDDPGVPTNGRRVLDDFTAGSRIFFSCDDGFTSRDQLILFCQDDGSWDAPLPQCLPNTAASMGICTGNDDVIDEFGRICSCENGQLVSCCRYRQDWTMLTDLEKQRYINTVLKVATDPTYQPLYTALVLTYAESFNTLAQYTVSEMSFFFPWHKYFLLEYENLLRLVDKEITIPLWDWSLLPTTPYQSPVFDPQTGFGNSSNATSMCVNSGPFREGQFEVNGGGCLKRDYGDYQFPSRELIDQFLSLDASKFDEFHTSMQLLINLNMRCFIGGQMCTPQAANDPLYLLHLARLDRVFDRWQRQSSDNKNVRYTNENDPLVLTFDNSLLVSDFSCNDDLPYGVCVRYGPLQDVPPTTQNPTSSSEPDLPTIRGLLSQTRRQQQQTEMVKEDTMNCIPKERIENLSLNEEEREQFLEICGYI